MKKEIFYNDAKKFIERNLMKEIYANDNLSICNMVDSLYVLFMFEYMNDNAYGIIIDAANYKKIIESIINDEFAAKQYFASIPREKIVNFGVSLNEKTLTIAQEIQKKVENTGPEVDLQWEQELMSKNKSR